MKIDGSNLSFFYHYSQKYEYIKIK